MKHSLKLGRTDEKTPPALELATALEFGGFVELRSAKLGERNDAPPSDRSPQMSSWLR
jgi:hypothetical protein